MTLRIARFLSLLCVALTLGLAFCHVMEIAGKLRLGAADWLTVQHNLYVAFGPPVGAGIEVAAIALTWLVALLARHRRPAFGWTVAAGICVTLGLVAWGLIVAPMNEALNAWTAATLPADWTSYRNQWELGHAVHAGLFALGFGALVIAILSEVR